MTQPSSFDMIDKNQLKRGFNMQNKNKQRTRRIALLVIFTTLILLQTFVPLMGYIPIPPLNPTIIHLTVIIATITLGTVDGMVIGGVWGIARMVKAITLPSSPLDPLLWTNPLIALVPRVLIGLFTGILYHQIFKRKETTSFLRISASAVVGSFTNTIFVLWFIYLFYGREYAQVLEVDYSQLATALGVVIATNGTAEALSAAILSPLIARPLLKRKIH